MSGYDYRLPHTSLRSCGVNRISCLRHAHLTIKNITSHIIENLTEASPMIKHTLGRPLGLPGLVELNNGVNNSHGVGVRAKNSAAPPLSLTASTTAWRFFRSAVGKCMSYCDPHCRNQQNSGHQYPIRFYNPLKDILFHNQHTIYQD